MKKIVIAQPLGISKKILDSLTKNLPAEDYSISAYDTLPSGQDELGKRLSDADIAIIANYPLTREALAQSPRLKYLCVAFTGVDHVDIDYCKENGIAVSNCAGYSTQSVAELVFGTIISLYRRLMDCDSAVRSGRNNTGLIGTEIGGKKFGIIGTGAIGIKVAQIARSFGCETYGYSRTEKDASIQYVDLKTLLTTCDIISIHLPLTSLTKGLITENELSLMKRNAIIINTARGPIMDYTALANALSDHTIAGAAIDVYENEPPLPESHPLLKAPNLILTPHIGFDTEEAMHRRAIMAFDNIYSWFKGIPLHCIC